MVSFRVPSSAYTWSNETINVGSCTKRSGGVHQLVFLQLSYSGFCFGSCARPRDGSHHRIASTAHGYSLELYFQLWTAGGELLNLGFPVSFLLVLTIARTTTECLLTVYKPLFFEECFATARAYKFYDVSSCRAVHSVVFYTIHNL